MAIARDVETRFETTIDEFGRVVIPKRLRQDLGLRPGSRIEILRSDEGLTLRLLAGDAPLRIEEGVLVYGGRAGGGPGQAVRRGRDERIGGRPSKKPVKSSLQ